MRHLGLAQPAVDEELADVVRVNGHLQLNSFVVGPLRVHVGPIRVYIFDGQ